MASTKNIAKAPYITTALLLAAGTGSRLQPLTLDAPKCLTEVGGIPILERLINNLRAQGFDKLIVVIGHLGDSVKEFLQRHASDMVIEYVVNPDFKTTNNIYSLWLARHRIKESFLLVESDLVFESHMLDDMLQPDKIAVSRKLPWMNGTTVALGTEQRVTSFSMGGHKCNIDDTGQFKTVNIYSLSFNSWKKIEEQLSRYVSAGRLGEYYEAVFATMIDDGSLTLNAVQFDADLWYEIDTREDLLEADNLFNKTSSNACRSVLAIKSAATIA